MPNGANPWKLENFAERFDAWADLESPDGDLRCVVMATRTRESGGSQTSRTCGSARYPIRSTDRDTSSPARIDVRVAGVAALLIAKCYKLGERFR